MEVKDFKIQSCVILGLIFMLKFSQGIEQEYVSKTYFEKHEILDDSKFESFLKDELTLGLCQIRVLGLDRNLIGEGSHRRLYSSIRLESSDRFSNFCEAIFVERLPSGVFADPFELQHLVQRRVFKDAAVFGDTNLELPSFRSNRSVVEVHVEIGPKMLSEDHKKLETNIDLPLHARYQPLGHGFSRVEFGLPDILLRCRVEDNFYKQNCLLVQSVKYEEGTTVWEMPCGNKEHAEIVSIVTFVSAILSAFLIVLTACSHSSSAIGSHRKQS